MGDIRRFFDLWLWFLGGCDIGGCDCGSIKGLAGLRD